MVRAASTNRRSWFTAAVAMVIASVLFGCAHKPAEAPAGPDDAQAPPNLISRIGVSGDEGKAVVRIEGLGMFAYSAVKRAVPPAVIFYFQNTRLTEDFQAAETVDGLIAGITASEMAGEGLTVRVEIELETDVPYEVDRADGKLQIVFEPPGGSPAAAETAGGPGPTEETIAAAPAPEETIPAVVAAPAPPAPPATRLLSVNTAMLGNGVRIHVKADGRIGDYKDFTLANPARIVFDIFGVASPSRKQESIQLETPWVRQVRHFGDDRKLRLVLDTQETYLQSYAVGPVSDGLVIQVLNPGDAPAALEPPAAAVPAAVEGPAIPETAPAAARTAPPEPPAVPEAVPAAGALTPDKPAWVNEISFSSEEDGKSTVTVGTTRPVLYRMSAVSDKVLRLELFDTNIPEYRKRALITTRFESAVDRITPVQKPDMGATTMMVFELREGVAYNVTQEESFIRVRFGASVIPPKPFEAANLPPWKRVLEEVETAGEAPAAGAEGAAAAAEDYRTAEYAATHKVKQYTGEKIALDFYETDIKNVFRILREVSGRNFAIDKNVSGRVTLTLDDPVPWDQILDLVLKMNQLGMIEEGNILRIATLETIRKEDEQRRKAFEAERQALAEEQLAEPVVTEYIPVNYSNAKNEVLPHVQSVLSDRGVVSVDTRNNQLIVTDTAAQILRVRELVREIDKVTPQVLIEARVVEVNDTFAYEFGIEWDLAGGIFDPPITSPQTGQGSNAEVGVGPQRGYDSLGGTYNYTTDMNFPAESANSSIGFSFTRVFGSPLIINAIINAVETKSEGRIISSPKVLTLDNKKARIKQGLEFPYLERDDAGGSAVKFKDIDLLLEVTPQITPDDRISMNIFITKNDVAAIVAGVPAISTNEAETELLVNDGDTIVIGGILKASTTISDTGWPVLKDIPIAKWFFRTDAENKQNQELLIFITPRIVKLEQREI